MAALEQGPKRYIKLYECKSTELVSPSGETPHPRSFLDSTVQHRLTDPPYDVCRKRDANQSAYNKLSASNIKEAVERETSVLRPGGHAVVFCTAQQSATWRG